MTQELIPLTVATIGTEEQKTVNARDLHAFLEVGKDFSTWIKDKIEKYDFKEGKDYVKFSPNSGKTSNGGRPRVEYFLAVGMAKEISMLENNEKGNQARKYFLACEEELKALKLAVPDYTNLPKIQILKMAIESEEQRLAAEQKNEELTKRLQLAAPKEKAYDEMMDTQGLYTGTYVGCNLLKVGSKFFFGWRKNHGLIYRSKNRWASKWPARKNGWIMDILNKGNNKQTGDLYERDQIYFTTKGVLHIHAEMLKEKIEGLPESIPSEQLNLNFEGAKA